LRVTVEEGACGGDVLQALPAGAEGVVVHTGDGVGGGRTGDVEDLVLLGLLGHRDRDAGDDGAGQDLVVLPDEVLGGGDRGVRHTGVVAVGDLDLPAVDRAGAVGGVVDARLEALLVLRAVGGQRAGLGVDDADLVRVATGLRGGAGGAVAVVGAVVVVVVAGVVIGGRGARCQRQDRGH